MDDFFGICIFFCVYHDEMYGGVFAHMPEWVSIVPFVLWMICFALFYCVFSPTQGRQREISCGPRSDTYPTCGHVT